MKIFGQLESAQLENLAADPANSPYGRVYFNTVSQTVRFFNGASWTGFGTSSSTVTGSKGSPTLITAAGGIGIAGSQSEMQFIAGNGAAIDITKNPQITAGTTVGQTLELIGCNATNTVLLEDGTGLDLNGPWLADLNSTLGLRWDGTNWSERFRR